MAWFDPNVSRYLLADEGEIIIDEVRKHWAAVAVPLLELVAAVVVLIGGLWGPAGTYWFAALVALSLAGQAAWRILSARMDRFVITNIRVFRVHGVLSRDLATMPISRILDIAVHTPLIGRVLGFGHFVFESAAQDQGLRDIRYVGRPDERDMIIQRVIQRAGLRGTMRPGG